MDGKYLKEGFKQLFVHYAYFKLTTKAGKGELKGIVKSQDENHEFTEICEYVPDVITLSNGEDEAGPYHLVIYNWKTNNDFMMNFDTTITAMSENLHEFGLIVVFGNYSCLNCQENKLTNPPSEIAQNVTSKKFGSLSLDLVFAKETSDEGDERGFFLTFSVNNRIGGSKQEALLKIEELIEQTSRDDKHIDNLSKLTKENKSEEYKKVLSQHLFGNIAEDKTKIGLIERMSEALALLTQHEDEELNWIEFWVAYESISKIIEQKRITPRDESEEFPIYGFSFDLNEPVNQNSKKMTLPRKWLNIILKDNDNFKPKAVHDWFMEYRQIGDDKIDYVESLTLYTTDEKNAERAIYASANSTKNHKRFELLSWDKSGSGQLWGIQLANVLNDLSKKEERNAPIPWPYEKEDIAVIEGQSRKHTSSINSFQITKIFEKENSIINENQKYVPTQGWFRINLYSLFLLFTLGNKVQKANANTFEWISHLLVQLKKRDSELSEKVNLLIRNSSTDHVRIPINSLCWIAPPINTSGKNDEQSWLGSGLILSSHILRPDTVKESQSLLRTLLTTQRNAEVALKDEKKGEKIGELDGLRKADTYFNQEVIEHIHFLNEYTHPFKKVFSVECQNRGKCKSNPVEKTSAEIVSQDKSHIGSIKLRCSELEEPDLNELCSKFLTINIGEIYNLFYEQWILWGSTEEWFRYSQLDKETSVFKFIKESHSRFIRGGVLIKLLKDKAIYEIDKIKEFANEIKKAEENAINRFQFDPDEDLINLQWKSSDRKDFQTHRQWFVKMLSASIMNAMTYRDENENCKITVERQNSNFIFTLIYPIAATFQNEVLETKERVINTKKILESGALVFNVSNLSDKTTFCFEKSEKSKWKTLFTIPYESIAEVC